MSGEETKLNMEEKIKQHFNGLFAEAPKTRKMLDLKQEMMQNALDKYNDLRTEGYTEEDAYQNVIHSIGDVSELFAETEEEKLFIMPENERKKCALLRAVSVGMYLFAGVVFLFFGMMYDADLGLCAAGLICIPPTIMLVYAANMYPGYVKKEKQDMVEEYKEQWYTKSRDRAVRKSVSTIIWTLALIVYFAVSFSTFAWYITWIIFLIAACIQAIAGLIFSLKENKAL